MNLPKLKGEMWEAQAIYDEITHIKIVVANVDIKIDTCKKQIRELLHEIKALKVKRTTGRRRIKKLEIEQEKLRDLNEILKDIDTAERTNLRP